MNKRPRDSYLVKPVEEMRVKYSAMALYEFLDYVVFSSLNPAIAPESNFLVAKVPKYSLDDEVVWKTFRVQPDMSRNVVWQSEPIEVSGWNGFEFSFVYSLEGGQSFDRSGFVFAKFYDSEPFETYAFDNVRLSSRFEKGEERGLRFVADIPPGAKYMVLGIQFEDLREFTFELGGDVVLSKVGLNVDYGGYNAGKLEVDEDIIFPNSHGNL
jgi:hypothetical protein